MFTAYEMCMVLFTFGTMQIAAFGLIVTLVTFFSHKRNK